MTIHTRTEALNNQRGYLYAAGTTQDRGRSIHAT
jgi:hypothetical protein